MIHNGWAARRLAEIIMIFSFFFMKNSFVFFFKLLFLGSEMFLLGRRKEAYNNALSLLLSMCEWMDGLLQSVLIEARSRIRRR
jgi:hypothetical protein